MAKIVKKMDRPEMASSAVTSFPQPPAKNAEEYLKAYTGYAYTAVSSIAQEVASIELKLFKVKFVRGVPETEEILEHEILSMLEYMNPLTTFYDQVEATQVYEELTGEAFWVVLREGANGRGKPAEIWLLRPDWVKVVPDSDDVIGHYIYHPGGNFGEKLIIPKENMIHFKYFNPLNPYRGKGSVQSAALPLDIHTFAQEWNRNFFFNSAVPSLVFTSDKKISKEAVERFMNQWQASYGGRSKSNKVAFLGNGLKMDTATMKVREMDFTEQQRMMRDDVLAVFKVPKTILGLTEDVNRANAEATTRAFMERVVTPRMKKFVGALNEFLIPMYPDSANLFLDFVDPAPEDVEQKLKKYENARKYGWMTANEVRAEENLEPVEGGDDLAPVGSSNPVSSEPAEPQDPNSGDDNDPDADDVQDEKGLFKAIMKLLKKDNKVRRTIPKKKFKHMVPIPKKKLAILKREELQHSLAKDLTVLIGQMLRVKDQEDKAEALKEQARSLKNEKDYKSMLDEEEKDKYWKQFIQFVDTHEEEIYQKAQALFAEDEYQVLQNLENLKYWKAETRKGKESSLIEPKQDMIDRWVAGLTPVIKELIIEQGNYVLDFLGVQNADSMTGAQEKAFISFTETVMQYLKDLGLVLIAEISETTREALRDTLAEGLGLGESVEKLRKRIQDIFKEASTKRARTIAITESLRASNFASVEAYRQSGVVEAKEWLAERDEKVCPFCMDMDGRIVELNEVYFENGDEFTVTDSEGNQRTMKMSVGDVGYPPLHPRCRCTTIPVLVGQREYNPPEGKVLGKSVLTQDIQKVLEAHRDEILSQVEEGRVVDVVKEKVEEIAEERAEDIDRKIVHPIEFEPEGFFDKLRKGLVDRMGVLKR